MSEHKLVDGEAWAAAQVDAAARGLLLPEKPKRTKATPVKVRGVYFRARPAGEAIGPTGERGEWGACYFDATGLKHREKAGTKSAALSLYQKRKSEIRAGRQFPESLRRVQAVSLAAICADYVQALKVNGRDARGQVKASLREVQAILGDVSAASIRPQDIEALKAKLAEAEARGRGRTRKPASVNRYVQDIRAAYNLARRNGLLDVNPAAGVKLLRENNERVREISPDEEKAILAALDPSGRQLRMDLRPLVLFLLETGLRLSEACGLTWGDVDIKAEVATLRQTKAGKVQHVYLSAKALDILRALGAQADDLARRNGKTQRNPFVFGWPDGRPLKPNCVSHAFRLAAERAGVANVHLHDARHAAACRWLRAGVGIYTVSKLLRHSTVKMSERYAHLDAGDLRAAVNFTSDTPTDTGKKAAS